MVQNLFMELIAQYGYIGIFLISLISNGTIIFPVPYLIVLYGLGTSNLFNPLLVGIVSGFGATLGELTLYLLASLGRYVLPKEYRMKAEKMKLLIDKYGPIIIFIFAATPLPDDIIYPSLGFMRYNVIKVFLSCFLGKALLALLAYLAGYYSATFIESFLAGESIIVNIISILLGIIIAIIILKVDWEKFIRVEESVGEAD